MVTDGRMHVVILSGGAGTRLWPISRRSRPKPFQALLSTRTMLQDTYLRVLPLSSPERIWVVTGAEFASLAHSQLPQVPRGNILGEPVSRSSAPAAALAVACIARREPEAIVLVTPADSYIRDAAAYHEYVGLAAEVAAHGSIVTLGIVPSGPETGYGYIQRGARMQSPVSWAYQVARFTEKPDAETAARYAADGGYYWNMGHFIFRAGIFMERCARHLPEVADGMRKLAASGKLDGELITSIYRGLPTVSLDYGIAEKEKDLVVIPTALEWSDVGTWGAVKQIAQRHGTAGMRAQNHIGVDSEDCFVLADSGRLVVTVGVEGYVIVDTPDALLVVREDRAQEVRQALEEIQRRGKDGYL